MKIKNLSILVLLLLAALTFSFAAFGNAEDKDENNDNDNTIVGKWTFDEDLETASVVTNNPTISSAIEKQLLDEVRTSSYTLEFKMDGTCFAKGKKEGTYTYK